MFFQHVASSAPFIFVAGITVLVGSLLNDVWRRKPHLPLAALFIGPIMGWAALEFGGARWGGGAAIFATFIGTLIGPTLVAWLQDPKTFAELVGLARSKLGGGDR